MTEEYEEDGVEVKQERDYDLIKTENGYIFNPYNPCNVQITLSDVQYILTSYGLPPTVRNFNLYKRAFVHRSYTKRPRYENNEQHITIVEKPDDCLPLSSKSNERMEFVGDGLLECVTKLYLYKRFPKANEKFMTNKKIAIVKNEAIGRVAYDMGLHKWLIISKHAEEKKIRTNFEKLGCLFEAFIAAVFLNYETNNPDAEEECDDESPGFKMTKKLITNIFEKHIDWVELIQCDDNYKNILQVKIQKEFKVTPHYLEIEKNAEFGYKMGVYLCLGQPIHCVSHENALNITQFHAFKDIHDYVSEHSNVLIYMGEGQHKIKKKAEQVACNEAIHHLAQF
jgi:dsRNA-specific ribonuclease